jgi:hypothetical protein
MNEHGEVTLETDHLEEVIDTPPPGQPVVVIQYRTRGLPWYVILPAFAIVAFVAAAASYSFVTSRARPYPFSGPPGGPVIQSPSSATAGLSDRPGSTNLPSPAVLAADLSAGPLSLNTQPVGPSPTPPVKVAQQPATTTEPAPASTKAQTPLLASNTASLAAPPKTPAPPVPPIAGSNATQTAVAPTPDPAVKPVVRSQITIGFTIPGNGESPFDALPISPKAPRLPRADERQDLSTERALADAVEPDQKPTPSLKEFNEQLRAEAAKKKAEINQLRDVKDQARSQVAAESQARVDDERGTFHDQLSEIVHSRSSKAGKQIDELCNQYGRAYDTELRAKVTYHLAHMPGRTSREAKVKFLRDVGVPEPAILDFLANELHRYINSRNGPRDSNEVRVSAARLLLSLKLPKPSSGAPRMMNPLIKGPARSSLPAVSHSRATAGTP